MDAGQLGTEGVILNARDFNSVCFWRRFGVRGGFTELTTGDVVSSGLLFWTFQEGRDFLSLQDNEYLRWIVVDQTWAVVKYMVGAV